MVALAIQARALTQAELADRLGITQGTVSKILAGMQPFPEELFAQLEEALGYPLSFYSREWEDEPDSPFFFRRRMATKQSDLKQTEARRRIIRRQIKELLSAIDRKPPMLPKLDPADVREGPIGVAHEVRGLLKVPTGPITKLFSAIERTGCIIVPFDFHTGKIDACCDWIDDIPIIFVDLSRSPSRLRFSLAHELAHLVMHDSENEENEEQANEFASEFLLPSDEIRPMLSPLNIARLGQLKGYWKTSMQAILVKAHRLGAISGYTYRQLNTQIGYRGFKYSEPFEDLIPREEPRLLKQLVSVYADSLQYTVRELSEKVSLSETEFVAQFSGGMFRVVV